MMKGETIGICKRKAYKALYYSFLPIIIVGKIEKVDGIIYETCKINLRKHEYFSVSKSCCDFNLIFFFIAEDLALRITVIEVYQSFNLYIIVCISIAIHRKI